jgi:hypothetical protein
MRAKDLTGTPLDLVWLFCWIVIAVACLQLERKLEKAYCEAKMEMIKVCEFLQADPTITWRDSVWLFLVMVLGISMWRVDGLLGSSKPKDRLH